MTARRLSLITLLLTSSVLVGCQGGQTDMELVAKAEQHQAQGDTEAAVIELKNALKKNSDNAAARALLGGIYLDSGDLLSAEKELTRAVALDDTNAVAELELFEVYVLQAKFEQIIEQLDPATYTSLHDQSRAYGLLGNAYYGQGETALASTLFNASLEIEDNAAARLGAIKVAATKLEPAETQLMIEDALGSYAQDLDLNLYAAKFYLYEQPDYNKALDLVSQLIPAYSRPEVLQTLAQAQFALQEYSQAEATLDDVLKMQKGYPPALFLKGKIRYAQDDHATAQNLLEQVLLVAPNHDESILLLGSIYLDDNQLERARNMLQRYWRENKESRDGALLLASIYSDAGEYVEAENVLLPVVTSHTDDVAVLEMLTSAILRQGRISDAEPYLRRLLEISPDSNRAKYFLGATLLSKGKASDGIAVLEQAVEDDNTRPESRALLITSYLQRAEFEKAAALAKTIQEENPELPIGWNYLGLVSLAQGREDEAKEQFLQALAITPNDPAANFRLAELARADKDYALAQSHYDAIYAKYPNHFTTRIANASLYSDQENFQAAVEQLAIAVAANPGDIPSGLLLSSYYMRYGNLLDSLTILAQLEQNHGDLPVILASQVEAMLHSGFYQEALSTALRLVATNRDSSQFNALKAAALIKLQDFAGARTVLQKALSLDSNNLRSQLELAELEMAEGRYAQASAQLSKIASEQPQNHQVLISRGKLAFAQGKFEDAATLFNEALAVQANSEAAGLLGKSLWQAGDKDTAMGSWNKWLEVFPHDRNTRLLLTKAYKVTGDMPASIEQLEILVSQNPNDALALNMLAWELRNSDIDRATSFADQAFALAPENLNVADTRAVLLQRQGRHKEATLLMRDITSRAPGNPVYQLHLAQLLAETGATEEALKIVSTVLQSPEAFPERPEAEALRSKLAP